MTTHATLHFYGNLNDFLPKAKRGKAIEYTCHDKTSLKDVIEAIGVPHVEVAKVAAQENQVSIYDWLQEADSVSVFPFTTPIATGTPAPIFILDVHLGKLARSLRMLGFDTLYENTFDDPEIVAIAAAETRIVLTRDIPLLKHKVLAPGQGYWLRSQHPDHQLMEIVHRFDLLTCSRPFYRCMLCNGLIEPVAKEAIIDQLEPNTRAFFTDFYQCSSCGKIYWKGSHYEKMQHLIAHMRHTASIYK